MGSRERILASAEELFYREGVRATSVEEILSHCGVAKSNFYYHFKSKAQVALEVLNRQAAEFMERASETLEDTALTPRVRLERFFESVCAVHARPSGLAGCPFANLAGTLPHRSRDDAYEPLRMGLCEVFRHIEARLAGCISEGSVLGEFRTDISPAELALVALSCLEGVMLVMKTYSQINALESGLTTLRKLICAA
ncbi:MAG TPA: TetR/AcrR family transcriptional regulator [Chthonomonadales bacterium]|nr:TetR/AcrR family transcriptional regulator [Chthonomonadales bacterium]